MGDHASLSSGVPESPAGAPRRGLSATRPFEVENPADFAVANHYTATHPDSPFVNRLMMRALTADGRVTLHNRDATITRDGMPESLQLTDRNALRQFLAAHFRFDFPQLDSLRVPTIPEWI